MTRTGGTANANYRVCFTGTATIDSTAAGTIPDAADYQPLTIVSGSGFPAGSNCVTGETTSIAVDGIRVKGDTDAESDETVIATLSLRGSNPGVTLGASVATHTILDDDTPAPEISVSLPTSEGESRSDDGEKKVSESEGGVGIGFNLAANQPLPSALTVCVRVTESGTIDRVASADEGIQTANMPSSVTNGSGTHTLTWTNTAADDPDSSVTVEVVAPSTVGCSADNDSYTVSSSDASDKLLIQDDEDTTVELTSTDPTMTEGDASDTAVLAVSLDRRLYAGETIGVPIALATTTGARLPGSTDSGTANHDFTVSAAAGTGHTGVTLANASTANPRVVFTGHDTNTVQTATVTLTPVANRDDGDAAHETITATLSSLGLLDTTVSGGVTAHSSNNAETLTLEDDEAAPAACPAQNTVFNETSLRILESGETTYCVRLTTAPSGGDTTVTIDRDGANRWAANFSPTSLTFTSSDYMTPQQVTVTGADEPNTHRNRPDMRVTHEANGGGYSSQNLGNVQVEVDDAPELEAWPDYDRANGSVPFLRRPNTVVSSDGLTPHRNMYPGYELTYVLRLSNRPEPGGTVTVTATVQSDKQNLIGLSLTGPSDPLDGPAYQNWATNLPGTLEVTFHDGSPGEGTGCSNWHGGSEFEYHDSNGRWRTVTGGRRSETWDNTADTPWECWRKVWVVRKDDWRNNTPNTCADITHTATGGGVRQVTVDTVRVHLFYGTDFTRARDCPKLTGNTLPPQGSPAEAPPPPTDPVTNLQVTAVDDASASVAWDAVPHATSYDVSWSAESSDSLNASAGALPGVTGTSATIQHDASVAMTLTVTVTPEYVDEHGQTRQLPSLAGTATLDVGPQGGGLGGDGGTDGDGSDDDGPVDSGEGKVDLPSPVAHWTFDGDADDAAGSSDGTATGGAAFAANGEGEGVGSHALSLDGVDDHVDLASHVSNFPLGDAARTLTGWFRANAGNQGQSFFSYGPNVAGQRFSIAADRTQVVVGVSSHAWGTKGLSLSDGWHHVAVSYAGGDSDGISIYLDGALQAASTQAGSPQGLDTRSGPAAIGRNVRGTKHYAGLIDDVRIYDVALRAEQVTALFDEQQPPPPPPPPAISIPAPVAHWTFDGDADDAAGSSDGTANNGASFTTSASVGSHALSLDGADDYVDLASHVSSFPLGDAARSVTGWFRAAAGSQDQTFFAYGPNVAGQRFSVAADRTQVIVGVSSHAWGAKGLSLSDGWRHVAVTYSGGDSDQVSIYLDGVLQSASTQAGSARRLDTRTGPAAIGRSVSGAAHYTGSIDDVRIYDVALSAEQVQAIANHEESAQAAATTPGPGTPTPLAASGPGAPTSPSASGLGAPTSPSASAGGPVHVPLLPGSSNPLREGLVRIVNRSAQAGEVRIVAVDDTGWRSAPVTLSLGAGESAQFTSRDLEWGNEALGLTGSAGPGTGDWRLEVASDLELDVLPYVRSHDGALHAMGDVAPVDDDVHHVALFAPADSPGAAGRLRLTNRGGQTLRADITGIDDAGASPGGTVSVEIAAGASVVLTAAELEAGGANLRGALARSIQNADGDVGAPSPDADGDVGAPSGSDVGAPGGASVHPGGRDLPRLGDGQGQWRLRIASDGDLAVMNLIETSDGRLANLSGVTATAVSARKAHVVARFPSTAEASVERGVVRIVNSSGDRASIRIEPHDSTGWRYPPLTLTLGAGEAANLGAWDLEQGNRSKGLAGSTGPGTGGPWRLEVTSDTDIEVLAFSRSADGLRGPLPGGATAGSGVR